ncbi:MAG: tetratricopeptide repeat protein [Candidatus Melainabacteria bacterium]|nr:tetratricopeptide repeat protein [Candidatus Melainabacteria bacterium]
MNTKRILAQVIGFAAIIASIATCQAAYAESVGPCAGQTNIAASYKLNKLGHREYDRRNYIGAATYYSKAIELNPRLTLAYACRSDCYHKIGDCARAHADYNKALELEPNDSFVLGGRAEEKLDLHYTQGAIADFDAAINMGPTYFFLYSGRAKLRLENNDYTGAIDDCNKGLQKCPIASDLYWCRGKAFEALGKLEEARRDYSKAIELHPTYLRGYERRALIEFKMGNLAGGICDYVHARPDCLLLLPTALLLVFALEIPEFIPTIIEVKSCWR